MSRYEKQMSESPLQFTGLYHKNYYKTYQIYANWKLLLKNDN